MIIFLVAIILSIILSIFLWFVAFKLYDMDREWLCIALSFMNLVFDIIIIIGLIMIPMYLSSKYSVELINKKYDTQYTAEQYFFAGSTIDKIIKTDENLLDTNNKINLDITNK